MRQHHLVTELIVHITVPNEWLTSAYSTLNSISSNPEPFATPGASQEFIPEGYDYFAENYAAEAGSYEEFAYGILSRLEQPNSPPLVAHLPAHAQPGNSGPGRSPSPHTPSSMPTQTSMCAAPAGTLLSPARQAALHRDEQCGANVIAEALIPPQAFDVIQDDNWEDDEGDSDGDDVVITPCEGDSAEVEDEMDAGGEASRDGHSVETATVGCSPPIPLAVPIAQCVPGYKLAENTPDPFFAEDVLPLRPPVPIDRIHPMPGVFLVYLLVSWLHLQFHLPFRACNVILGVFVLVIRAFGVTINPPALSTLPSVMTKLDLEPEFRIFPVCPTCLEVYPDGKHTPGICSRCNSFIYKARPLNARSSAEAAPTPLLRFPFKSLESQLIALLAVPGVETELDKWRTADRTSEVYKDIYDGNICKNLKGHDGQRFFCNDPVDKAGPDGELRIGVTLGVDWYVVDTSCLSSIHIDFGL